MVERATKDAETNRALSAYVARLIPWLERRRSDRMLARLLVSRSPSSAEQGVIAERASNVPALRSELARRRREALALAPRPLPARPPESVSEAASAPTVQRRAPATARERELPWPGDAAAQAQTLRDAAANGTPFCEICERARRKTEAAGASASGPA